jgi:SAM-dependent methyltransferase
MNWVPYRIRGWLNRRMPHAHQLLRYHTWNLNTARHWDSAWERHGMGGFRATGEAPGLRQRIVELVPPGARVLDIGCGIGEILSMLRQTRQCRCAGMDISPAAIRKLLLAGIEGKVSALPEVPFPSASFDAVLCTETLEHVSNVNRSLAEIRRVLKPGGLFLASVPNGENDRDEAHVHRFHQRDLERLLRREFEIDSIESIEEPPDSTLFAMCRKSGEILAGASS